MNTQLTLLKIDITIDERWAVGTWPNAHEGIQLPVLVDPRTAPHKPYLPGTSLAGSLKRHLKALNPALDREWMGPDIGQREQVTGHKRKNPRDAIGRLVLLGCLSIDVAVSSRGSTAIDGARGAARAHTQRLEQWAEPTTITLVAQHDGGHSEPLVKALTTWRPVIGRAHTRGMGAAHVSKVVDLTLDLAKADQLQWWLASRDTWLRSGGSGPAGVVITKTDGAPQDRKPKQPWSLVAKEPVHIGVTGRERQDDGLNAAPTLTSRGKLIVPGSAWKGVFAHRAEVILTACGATPDQRDTVLHHWFGTEKRRGQLRFGDTVTDATKPSLRTHVAIDRFTGGARDSALHRVLAIPAGTHLWLTVDAKDLPGAVTNLLNHIVNDLHDGLATLGGHGTRGYGWVQWASGKPAKVEPVSIQDLLAVSAPPESETSEGQVA